MVKIQVNGKETTVENKSLKVLLDQYENLREKNIPFAVLINGSVVRKANHDETYVNEGDTIEIVSCVGGG